MIQFIVGLSFVLIGFLTRAYPNLIAGYNTMSEDKKKNVDIDGLSLFFRNGFITIGVLIILGYYLFALLGFQMIANLSIVFISIIGTFYLVFQAQKYDHNPK